jgi:hypothetical protein
MQPDLKTKETTTQDLHDLRATRLLSRTLRALPRVEPVLLELRRAFHSLLARAAAVVGGRTRARAAEEEHRRQLDAHDAEWTRNTMWRPVKPSQLSCERTSTAKLQRAVQDRANRTGCAGQRRTDDGNVDR